MIDGSSLSVGDVPPRVPASGFAGHAWHGAVSYLSGHEFLSSYLIAVVLYGVALLAGMNVYVSHQWEPGTADRMLAGAESKPGDEPVRVGRITGMFGCQWADSSSRTVQRDDVPLGRRYVLRSGLMEITYDSGAKVILQGPAAYEVESRDGGYLSLGKLTARVETKGEGGRGKAEETENPKSETQNPKSPSPLPPSAFVVRTPTAVITDLGTEFGVEVAGDRRNNVYVFQGRVAVRPAVHTDAHSDSFVLREGESAALDSQGAVLESPPSREAEGKDFAAQFVRRMPLPARLGVLDLLDIVAGGNGVGHLRGAGIDPASGDKDSVFPNRAHQADQRYHAVPSNRLIDGVFVPNGNAGPVQLDSAGHAYALPETNGRACGSIWARAADLEPEQRAAGPECWVYGMGRGGEYMPEERGLLGLHANAGITFDLAAICKAHPGVTGPVHFRAFAGLANREGLADLWVFVDGQLKYRRTGLVLADSPVRIEVDLSANDRFLTLVSTDGNHTNLLRLGRLWRPGIAGDFAATRDRQEDVQP